MKYIENFASLMPSLQGNKVIQRIEKMRETGEIQTESEYRQKLNEILSSVSTTSFTPSFEYIPFREDKSSSEHYNYMMERIKDDLEVAFIELNNIFATIKAHDNIFKDKLLDELHYTLKKLEDETDNLVLMHDAEDAFDDVQVNSFSGDNYIANKNDEYANELFYDERKEERIQDESLANIDNQEGSLGLPLLLQDDIEFAEANIRTAKSTGTEIDVEVEDSNIKNILDPESSSGWTYNVLSSKTVSDGAKLTLELDLGDKREINYLVLHPASDFPVVLDSIEYTDINNNLVEIPDTSYFKKTISKPLRITFTDIIAKRFVFTFTQQSSVLFDYNKANGKVTLDDLKRNNKKTKNVNVLSGEIVETIRDPDALGVIPLSDVGQEDYSVYYQYVFAFKKITAGLSRYRDDGYFISKKYKKRSLALLALESEEVVPKYYNQGSDVEADIGSIEYDIVKKDYNTTGEVIRSTKFPILPTSTDQVKNERLFFTMGKKVVTLRFLAHLTSGDGSGIKIYRNNIELIRGTDWRFADRSDESDYADPSLLPDLSETRIEIMHTDDVVRNGIYTADYAPRYILEPNSVVKTPEGVTYLNSGVTEHDVQEGVDEIEYSDNYLKVSVRNNSFEKSKTAKLNHYRLAMSSVNKNRHVRV